MFRRSYRVVCQLPYISNESPRNVPAVLPCRLPAPVHLERIATKGRRTARRPQRVRDRSCLGSGSLPRLPPWHYDQRSRHRCCCGLGGGRHVVVGLHTELN